MRSIITQNRRSSKKFGIVDHITHRSARERGRNRAVPQRCAHHVETFALKSARRIAAIGPGLVRQLFMAGNEGAHSEMRSLPYGEGAQPPRRHWKPSGARGEGSSSVVVSSGALPA